MIPSTTAETILVVDDHESRCELIEVILGRAGSRVLTATKGADALRLARSTPQIDLLWSDLGMPRMRGDDLARRFAALHPSAPVVFVSSSDCPIAMAEPFEFVSKPFTVAEIRDPVSRALRTRAASVETACAA